MALKGAVPTVPPLPQTSLPTAAHGMDRTVLCLAISSKLEVLPSTPSYPIVGKEAFFLGSPVPIPRPCSDGHDSPDLVSPTHSTGLGFPRGFSAVRDPGKASSFWRLTAQESP